MTPHLHLEAACDELRSVADRARGVIQDAADLSLDHARLLAEAIDLTKEAETKVRLVMLGRKREMLP